MADKVLGAWKIQTDEGFGEYIKAVGHKPVDAISHHEFITRSDATWTICSFSFRVTFTLGEPVSECTLFGRKVTSTFTIEGNKLVAAQQPNTDKELPTRCEREVLEDGRMLVTYTCMDTEKGDVTAKRYFEPTHFLRREDLW